MQISRIVLKRACTAFFAACTLAVTATAGINSFTSLGPEGGRVDKVEFHPTNPSIAFMSAGKFYRSTDAGISWQVPASLVDQPAYDFAVDPSNPNRVFVTSSSLHRSTDAGATFSALPLLSNYSTLNVEISRDGVIYVTANKQIFRSTDGGSTWIEKTSLVDMVQPRGLHVDPLDSNTLYVLAGASGFRSTDGAVSWHPITFPSPVLDMTIAAVTPRLLFAASPQDGVLVSSNDGTTWTSAGLTDPTYTVAVDPNDASILYAGTMQGIVRSGNQGGNWANVHGNARTGDINSIALSPVAVGLALVGGTEGVVRSITAGPPWIQANAGFVATSIDKFVATPSSNRIYLNTYSSGIFFLTSTSTMAQPLNLAGLDALNPNRVNLESFDLLAQDTTPNRLFITTNTGFGQSNDAGATWVSNTSYTPNSALSIAADQLQPNVMIASGPLTVRYSTDTGASWTDATGLPPNSEATSIAFAPSAANVAYAGIYSWGSPPGNVYHPEGVYKTTNGGASWTAVNNGLSTSFVGMIAVHPSKPDTVYITSDTGFFKTIDGATWSQLTWNLGTSADSEFINSVSIDSRNPDTIYVTKAGYIGRSIDGGLTWENVTIQTGTKRGASNVFAQPYKDHTILASTAGVSEMTLATDVEVVANIAANPSLINSATTREFTVRNLGPLHATQLRTTINVPASAGNISASATAGTCSVIAKTITCTQPVLLAGRATQISVTSTYPAIGDMELLATTQSSEPDLKSSNNSVRSQIELREAVDLATTAVAPTNATEGDEISYTFGVSNAGPGTASSAEATIQLIGGATIKSVTFTRGACVTNSNNLITCTLGVLANGASAGITVVALSGSQGTYTTTISATNNNPSSSIDPVSSNNTATVNTSVAATPTPTAPTVPTAPPITTSPTGGGTSGGSAAPASSGGGGMISWLFLALLTSIVAARARSPSRDPLGYPSTKNKWVSTAGDGRCAR